MEKSLKVTDNNGTHFTVTSTEDQIKAFLKWIAEYNRGQYDVDNCLVICKKPIDFSACHLRALRVGLSATQFTKKI